MMFYDVLSCVIMFNGCSNPTILRVQAEEHVDIIKPSLPVDQLTTQMALRCIKKKIFEPAAFEGVRDNPKVRRFRVGNFHDMPAGCLASLSPRVQRMVP